MIQIRTTMLVLLAAAVISAAGAAGAGEGVFLGYDFSEEYQQEYKVKFSQEVERGHFAFSQFIDMEVTEKCVGTGDSLYLMEITFDKVESARMQFDDMVDDPTGENLTGHAVTFNVNTFGEVSDMKPVGYIEGWQRMQDIVKSMVDSWYAYLPNEDVARGGTWTHEIAPTEEQGMTVEGEEEFEFKEVKKEKGRECARVQSQGETTVTGEMGTMDITGGGEGESEFYFCLKTSTMVKYKAKMDMKMEMTPRDGGDSNSFIVAFSMERGQVVQGAFA